MNIWDELSKVYNMPGLPDEAMSIIGDVMLAWSEGQEGDTISRKAAIDAIKNADVCVAWDDGTDDYDLADITIRATKGSVIKCIEELPSAQPEREHTMEEFMYGQDMGNPEDGSL